MRAWQIDDTGNPLDVMVLRDLPDPSAGEDQVVIEIEAAGIGFPDMLQVQGGYQVKPPLPFTPGNEMVGVITEVGAGVDGWSVGDRVGALDGGGLATHTTLRASSLLPVPDHLSSAEAVAMLVNHGTTLFALENRASIQPGETLLVTAAAGGAGSSAVQLGKALGARVIGLAGGPEKVSMVYDLGADVALDYREIDIVPTIRDITENRGVDVCYEAVGGDVFDQVRRCMAWDGRLLVIGFTSGRIPDVPANHVLLKNYSVVGVHWGASIIRDPEAMRRGWDRLVQLTADGQLVPPVTATRPLDEAAQALDDIGNRLTTGKVVVLPQA